MALDSIYLIPLEKGWIDQAVYNLFSLQKQSHRLLKLTIITYFFLN